MYGEVWKGFIIESKRHYFTYDEQNLFRLSDKDYFNTNTNSMCIFDGLECDEQGKILLENNRVIMINSWYTIKNYFGDKSGRHKRNKNFYIYQNNFYNDYGEAIKNLSREAKRALIEYQNIGEKEGLLCTRKMITM
ncbi:hypothetical protein OBV_p-00120 (plasmid) [Oscillibacter valericigenes Sjm18-20]|nr:hypothetical protein OBV_p-00120 [Oscillibacter valericigenes Sjm18-20]